MRRLAIPPAAVEPPDVAHDILGLVVHRLEVGAIGQMGRRPHLGEDLVEGEPGIHARHRLALERLQPFRGVLERLAHASPSQDGHAVAGYEQLRATSGHGAQRPRPLRGVTLDLLGITGVGRDPEEEVAREERAALGPPEPGMVVGLAARVAQLEPRAARLEDMGGVVDHRRIVVLRRPGGAGGELPRVDEAVPRRGEPVPIEAPRDIPVPDDRRSGPSLRPRLVEKGGQAARVIHVTMRVQGGVERTWLHGADGGERRGARGIRPRIHENESRLGANSRDIRPGMKEVHARGQLLALPGGPPHLARRNLPAPGALGQIEDVAHVPRTLTHGIAGSNRARPSPTPLTGRGIRG